MAASQEPLGPPPADPPKAKPFYKRWWFFVAAAVVVIGIVSAAVSGGSDGEGSPAASSSSSASAPAGFASVAELRDAAVAAGYPCPSWEQTDSVEAAKESGSCSDRDVFSIYAGRSEALEAATALEDFSRESGDGLTALRGENWIINLPDRETVDMLQGALGGTHIVIAKKDVPATTAAPDPASEMLAKIIAAIDTGDAFDTGTYVAGDIPAGNYAFVGIGEGTHYYSEEDATGNIIDNENFDSFGYVHVWAKGDIDAQGVLVSMDYLPSLGVSGAKQLWETVNGHSDWMGAGWYLAGSDIKAGKYTITAVGDGYGAVMSGPVGKNDIIDNEIIDGKWSTSVKSGQYLVVSGGDLAAA